MFCMETKNSIKKTILNKFYNFLPGCEDKGSIEQYIYLIDKNVNEKNVNNIAITGPYGSGKSSVIMEYVSKHAELNPCVVSLAKFSSNKLEVIESLQKTSEQNNKTKNDTSQKINTKNNDLINDTEKNILNKENSNNQLYNEIIKQIFLNIPIRKIFASKYLYLLKTYSIYKYILLSVLISFAIIIFGFLIKFDLGSTEKIMDLAYNVNIFIIVLCIFIIVALISIIIFHVEDLTINGKTFSFKLHDDKSNTIDKNTSEILYLFEKGEIKLVVFEDIDRFKDITIFTELRELNKTINTYIRTNNDYANEIKFIYSVKDDLFKNSFEKVKFFDAIIPVIPKVSSYNSFDVINNYLKDFFDNTNLKLSDDVVTEVAPYIHDMRLLKSICNEFQIFYYNVMHNKNGLSLSVDKLFYLVVYKHLFTEDFLKLYKNEGPINLFLNEVNNGVGKEVIDFNTIYNEIQNSDDNKKKYLKSLFKSFGEKCEENEFENIYCKLNDPENKEIKYLWNGLYYGYIDDMFYYYINYFYPGQLSINDVNFIQNVKDMNIADANVDYSLKIDNPDKIVQRLHANDFKNRHILNYDFIEYIYSIKDSILKNKISNLLDTIISDAKSEKNFIIDSKNRMDILYSLYNNNKMDKLLFNMKDNKNYSKVLNDIFSDFRFDEFVNIINNELDNNKVSTILTYIKNKNMNDITAQFDKSIIINLITNYRLSISDLNNYNNFTSMQSYIIDNNFYSISAENIKYIVKNSIDEKIGEDELILFKNVKKCAKLYSRIVNGNLILAYFKLWKENKIHVESNESFEELIDMLLNNQNELKYLIENCDANIENCNKYINNTNLIKLLMENNKIEITENNLLLIYNTFNKSNEYNIFINNNIDKIINLDYKRNDLLNFIKNVYNSLTNENRIEILSNSRNLFNKDTIVPMIKKMEIAEVTDVLEEKNNIVVDSIINSKIFNLLSTYGIIEILEKKNNKISVKLTNIKQS